jgi:hypothetical protein
MERTREGMGDSFLVCMETLTVVRRTIRYLFNQQITNIHRTFCTVNVFCYKIYDTLEKSKVYCLSRVPVLLERYFQKNPVLLEKDVSRFCNFWTWKTRFKLLLLPCSDQLFSACSVFLINWKPHWTTINRRCSKGLKNTLKPKGFFPLWSFRWKGRNITQTKTWRTKTHSTWTTTLKKKRGG